jgi:hypothetical protein
MKLAALLLTASLATAGIPAHLDGQLQKSLGFSPSEIRACRKSPAVIEITHEAGPRELSVAGIVRIDASVAEVAELLRRNRGLVRSADFQQSGTFAEPAVGSDVASYELPKGDLLVLSECEQKSCKFKLTESGIQEFRQVDWSSRDANAEANSIARRRMIDYVNAYRVSGWDSLAVFADKQKPMSVAKGLEELSAKAAYIDRNLPELVRQAEAPSQSVPAGALDVMHWTVKDYGYRPVTDLLHTVAYEVPDAAAGDPEVVMLQKRIFSSHYFQARLGYIGLFSDETSPEGPGTYLVYIDRSLFDGEITGIKRSLLVRGVLADTRAQLASLQQSFAAPR